MAYAMAIACVACEGRFPPENKYNIDATTIRCCARGTGMKVVVVKGSDSGPIQSRKISGQLDIIVKLMAMINAEGNISRTVLIIADDAIPEDKFFAHPLLGISCGGRVGDYGWIVFSRTRDACVGFWKFYFEHICIPEIHDVNSAFTMYTGTAPTQRSCLTMDSELKVMRAAMDSRILQLFEERRIDVVKVGAGHTAISKALDMSTFFRTMKKKLKRLATTGVTVSSAVISAQMLRIFRKLQAKHSVEISSLKRLKIRRL
jgi:hypothetical protein